MTVEEKREAVRRYCKSTRCGSCELFLSWCANYNKRTCPEPALDEALELIGYEQPDKEDNMSENKKPRLAEVLGVEVGEKLLIDGRNRNPYSVTDEGLIVDRDGGVCYEVVTYLFNHPNCLIREPRWTEQEIKDAKNIIRMFGEDRYPYVIKTMDGLPYLSDDLESLAMYTINLEPEIFPSLKCGETVKIADIIGGNI